MKKRERRESAGSGAVAGREIQLAQVPAGGTRSETGPNGELVPWSAVHQQEADAAAGYAADRLAAGTQRNYRIDWGLFEKWCVERGYIALPAKPQTIGKYLAALADGTTSARRPYAVGTIERKLACLSVIHRVNKIDPNPTKDYAVVSVMAGIRKSHGRALNQKAALEQEHAEKLCVWLDEKAVHSPVISMRDKALLLLGYFSGMRRSEIVSIDFDDVGFEPRGMTVHLRRSKTDQEGIGRHLAIPRQENQKYCPVVALWQWMQFMRENGRETGFVFCGLTKHHHPTGYRLDPNMVSARLKEASSAIGIDAQRLGGHSLRAGFVTSAFEGNAETFDVMQMTGHKNVQMVQRYYRKSDGWKRNAASKIKLGSNE